MVEIGSATLRFWGSLLAFGGLLNGYAHALHPVALFGAQGIGCAINFNVMGFLLPALILAPTAWNRWQAMPEGGAWSVRIGASMAMLSALVFAIQGVLPLDPRDLDASDSRLHAAAWTVWWVAFVPAALLLARGIFRLPGRRPLAMASVGIAVVDRWPCCRPQPGLRRGSPSVGCWPRGSAGCGRRQGSRRSRARRRRTSRSNGDRCRKRCEIEPTDANGSRVAQPCRNFNTRIVAASTKVIALDTIIGQECRTSP